jgi:hypothetical protein
VQPHTPVVCVCSPTRPRKETAYHHNIGTATRPTPKTPVYSSPTQGDPKEPQETLNGPSYRHRRHLSSRTRPQVPKRLVRQKPRYSALPDEAPESTGSTIWSLFPEDTKYFGSGNEKGPQQAMVNYRVDNLDELLTQLAAANVPIDPHREDADYGRFAWITDPEGNRIELWQPLAQPQ